MKRDHLLPIILCGGSGSRLWPLSRESYPKQYIDLIDDSSKTLLQQTLERLCGIASQEDPILICNEEHRFIVAEQLRSINVKPKTIILEPFARNTAPAIAIAAMKAIKNFLPLQPGDVEATAANTHLFESWVDFKPSTSIEIGLNKFAKWYREYY